MEQGLSVSARCCNLEPSLRSIAGISVLIGCDIDLCLKPIAILIISRMTLASCIFDLACVNQSYCNGIEMI